MCIILLSVLKIRLFFLVILIWSHDLLPGKFCFQNYSLISMWFIVYYLISNYTLNSSIVFSNWAMIKIDFHITNFNPLHCIESSRVWSFNKIYESWNNSPFLRTNLILFEGCTKSNEAYSVIHYAVTLVRLNL